MLFDPASGELEYVESDPLGRVDFGGCGFHEVTEELIYTSYEDDKVRRYFRDPEFAADFHFLEQQFGGKQVYFESRTSDDRVWVVEADSDTEPGETHIFDRRTRSLEFQFRIREKLPRTSLAEMKPLTYPSSDGLEIPAYLTLPRGLGTAPSSAPRRPARRPVGARRLGLLLNRPILRQPRLRRTHPQLSRLHRLRQEIPQRRQWSVGPRDAGRHHLGRDSSGEPGRRRPPARRHPGRFLWRLRVACWRCFPTWRLCRRGLYRRPVQPQLHARFHSALLGVAAANSFMPGMADPATPNGARWLNERSPLFSADRIRTPLLVVQGANDPRVNRAEAEQIVIALRDRGFPVDYILAPDEGHGFARPANNMAMYMAAEKFLATHLGGRYQEGGTPEVRSAPKRNYRRSRHRHADPQTRPPDPRRARSRRRSPTR